MARACFTLQVRPDRLDDYRAAHAAVWPEMLAALRGAGWRDYQLFLRPDGLLVGTADVDDLAAAQAAVGATEVSARWEAAMGPLFAPGTGDGTDKAPLELVFDLDAQLDAQTTAHPTTTEETP